MAQLLSNLPVGSKVKFGKHQVNNETPWSIIWTVVAKNHVSTPAYPSNSVTLHATNIIDLRAIDAKEPESTDTNRAGYGYNRYMYSNIHQWLNSRAGAGAWWSNSTSTDSSPSNARVTYSTGYDNRPGFLNFFTDAEYNAILNTTIRAITPDADVKVGAPNYYDIATKIFLPSMVEVGAGDSMGTEGTAWGYYTSAAMRMCGVNAQVINNTSSIDKPSDSAVKWRWWLRTPYYYSLSHTQLIYPTGEAQSATSNEGRIGVRPALNLSASTYVTDMVDADGCYAVSWNVAPYAPASINVPAVIYGGKNNVISWSATTDPNGDTIAYSLECLLNDDRAVEIYRGTALSYTHLLPFGTTSAQYQVRAIDSFGEGSTYRASTIRSSDAGTIINNNAPTIDGTDANLGVKSSGFSGTYKVNDSNNNMVTVTEFIDGVQIRAFVPTLGATNTYSITDNTWLALSNGSHTLTIRATDGIDTSVRTYTFTKLVESFTIRNSTPWSATTMPSRIMLVVTRNLPATATFKVEVCNNGHDTTPTWEDCTNAVRSGMVHVFSNKTKTATNWGVVVRVTVARNGATGACYVSAIGGNFE